MLDDAGSAPALRIETYSPGTLVTSAIVLAGVIRGIPLEETAMIASVHALFAVVPVLPFDAHAAEIYVRVPFKRARFHRLIAAHALSLGLTLITNNEADFIDLPALRVENWAP